MLACHILQLLAGTLINNMDDDDDDSNVTLTTSTSLMTAIANHVSIQFISLSINPFTRPLPNGYRNSQNNIIQVISK